MHDNTCEDDITEPNGRAATKMSRFLFETLIKNVYCIMKRIKSCNIQRRIVTKNNSEYYTRNLETLFIYFFFKMIRLL